MDLPVSCFNVMHDTIIMAPLTTTSTKREPVINIFSVIRFMHYVVLSFFATTRLKYTRLMHEQDLLIYVYG